MHPFIAHQLAADRHRELFDAAATRRRHPLAHPTFVMQRRVDRSFDDLTRAIVDRAIFCAECTVGAGHETALRLLEPFARLDDGSYRRWQTQALLLGQRNRPVTEVEIAFAPWSRQSGAELFLAPVAERPDRWSRQRLRRYFHHGHRAADGLQHLLRTLVPPG